MQPVGAQTILKLRCLRLSPSRWTAFFRAILGLGALP